MLADVALKAFEAFDVGVYFFMLSEAFVFVGLIVTQIAFEVFHSVMNPLQVLLKAGLLGERLVAYFTFEVLVNLVKVTGQRVFPRKNFGTNFTHELFFLFLMGFAQLFFQTLPFFRSMASIFVRRFFHPLLYRLCRMPLECL